MGRDSSVAVTVAPGNAGIPNSAPLDPETLTADDTDLVVIGPEAPLVDGLADRLRARGVRVLGPGADGARLEGSKAWMKDLFADAGIPTARHGTFTEVEPAVAFLDTLGDRYVVKTDGLAAGKGVVVTDSRTDAANAISDYLSGAAFGDAGRRIVVEEGLTGPEVSVFALCDGTRVVPMGVARDHKRIGDGDTGPNTGGMGAFSPVPDVDDALVDTIMDTAIEPTVAALAARGINYRGFLFCGLMLTPGGPKVLEYNVRFGDPEAQVVLPRLEGDLADLCATAADGALSGEPRFAGDAAVTVVCAAPGYPEAPETGTPITGVDAASAMPGVTVFAAGVAPGAGPGELVTAGGRVLAVTAQDESLTAARSLAYAAVGEIQFPGMQYRTDIGASAAGSDV
jgi:phosphoribosylamine--glycine ligase